jgi:hypothetical protein
MPSMHKALHSNPSATHKKEICYEEGVGTRKCSGGGESNQSTLYACVEMLQ